jgi:nucleoside-diphosphate-sugar epimerase
MLLRKFLDGEAVLEEGGRRYLNQIHRDDGAAALLRLAEAGYSSEIYNVTDNTPSTQREVYGWIADFLKRPLPPEGTGQQHKRGVTSKRVSNAKLRALGWEPTYPAYRDALPQLITTLE